MLQLRLIVKDEFWQNIFWRQNQNTWHFFTKRPSTVLLKKMCVICKMCKEIQLAALQKKYQNSTIFNIQVSKIMSFLLSW